MAKESTKETDRKYIKFKAKRARDAYKRGNTSVAERHVTELFQYLGLDESSETPIMNAIKRQDNNGGKNRLQQLRDNNG